MSKGKFGGNVRKFPKVKAEAYNIHTSHIDFTGFVERGLANTVTMGAR